MMAIHNVYVKPTLVRDGVVIDKDSATIEEVMTADTEMRILPDADVPNSAGAPTIKEYLEAEESDGYYVASQTNTTIVTQS